MLVQHSELFQAKMQRVKQGKQVEIQKSVMADKQQNNKRYYCLHYVRYADSYLIAFKGPKKLAQEIQKKTRNFIKSNLHLSLKKDDLCCSVHNAIRFLEFDIKLPSQKEKDVIKNRRILSFKKIRNRLINRKKTIENRYQKSLLNTYNSTTLKKLHKLMKKETTRLEKNKSLEIIAKNKACELKKIMNKKGIRWGEVDNFKDWIRKEYSQIKLS